ncbi:PH domain-containing protein [Luteipulveratus sp. YIM 133132]|uniref:PH domain-containing protein n=1 Tax=Luteipulveratus flavus TaxID=3031728 RepID=UPI0023AE950C|nr:PH domain-containing protein [Luteipulveratus sp. YIM 133132]MDE9364256.1 PH domain-containing protein [Luteipulveratus sp. YIM 133132]
MDLREPANRVSPRARAYWAVESGIGWVVLIVVQVVLLVVLDARPWWQWGLLALTVVLALVGLLLVPAWRYRVHRWEVSPTAVYTQRGWVTQERRIAPITRVQTVDTERGPLAQLFKLSTVTVTTASSEGALKIECLDQDVASRLVQDLTVVTDRTEDDAT